METYKRRRRKCKCDQNVEQNVYISISLSETTNTWNSNTIIIHNIFFDGSRLKSVDNLQGYTFFPAYVFSRITLDQRLP